MHPLCFMFPTADLIETSENIVKFPRTRANMYGSHVLRQRASTVGEFFSAIRILIPGHLLSINSHQQTFLILELSPL
jgi:hypothetical protein